MTCIQEVHLRKTDNKYLKHKALVSEFLSLAKTKKRGVVIYVKDELKPKKIWQDNDGRMLGVEVYIEEKKILIVGVYAPNSAKETFFLSLQQRLNEANYDNVILMGDFNAVMDMTLDLIKLPRRRGK